jgi:cephalosporin hydroxylase
MIPAFDTDGKMSRFMGFPMCQNRLSVPAWSYFIEKTLPLLIIEIGCWSGGFSCCLAIAMHNIGGTVWCCDKGAFCEDLIRWKEVLPLEFKRMDALSPEGVETIRNLIINHSPCVVLCDDGNKRKEFNTYAPFLKKNDVIAVHDYAHHDFWPWQEITDADVKGACDQYRLEPYMQDAMHPAGWLVRRKRK